LIRKAAAVGSCLCPRCSGSAGVLLSGPCTSVRLSAASRGGRSCHASRRLSHALGRIAFLLLLAQAVAAPAGAELARPDLCERRDVAGERPPDEVRRYRMLLNERLAGQEVFRFWRDEGDVRVLVDTRFEGDVLMFPADLRHCRDERWREQAGTLELVKLESATRHAVPFKPDYEIHIQRDPEGEHVLYRGRSGFRSFEERHPANTGAITPWSVRTVTYDRVLDLFAHGAYRIDSRLLRRATVDGREVVHYAVNGESPRHLWYEEGEMIHFCGQEPFGTYIETVLEAYADLELDALELNRTCAEVFERGER
jgi:hypothetical protein